MHPNPKIGVFDSGVGGLSMALAIQKALPGHSIIFKDDAENVPYGTKTIDEIYHLTKPILADLVEQNCEVIVIACNTVTTNLIERFRSEIGVHFVGMEPMVKPAAKASKTGVIAIYATPLTLSSQRYNWLKEQFAQGVRVLEPDCSDWSYMIENNRVDREKIAKTVKEVINQNADQIVLGCTHYHWIEDLIKDITENKAEVLKPEQAVIAQLKRVLAQFA